MQKKKNKNKNRDQSRGKNARRKVVQTMYRALSQSCAEQTKSFAGGHNP